MVNTGNFFDVRLLTRLISRSKMDTFEMVFVLKKF